MIRDFFNKVFPRELVAYIPGQKFIAALVVYVAAQALGLDSNQVVDLHVLGLNVTVEDVAAALAFYLWPTNKPVGE